MLRLVLRGLKLLKKTGEWCIIVLFAVNIGSNKLITINTEKRNAYEV